MWLLRMRQSHTKTVFCLWIYTRLKWWCTLASADANDVFIQTKKSFPSALSLSQSDFSDIVKQTWQSEIRLQAGFRLLGWGPWWARALLLVRSALGRPSEREVAGASIWTQSLPHFELWLARSTPAPSQALPGATTRFRVRVLFRGPAHCQECCQPCQRERQAQNDHDGERRVVVVCRVGRRLRDGGGYGGGQVWQSDVLLVSRKDGVWVCGVHVAFALHREKQHELVQEQQFKSKPSRLGASPLLWNRIKHIRVHRYAQLSCLCKSYNCLAFVWHLYSY